MPLRGKLVNLGDKLNEMTERNAYMKNVFELTQKEEQATSRSRTRGGPDDLKSGHLCENKTVLC